MNEINREGFDACKKGVDWFENPYPSGSCEAWQWDWGHQICWRAKQGKKS